MAVAALPSARHSPGVEMQRYYLRLRREHPPQGKHNALQKLAYTAIVLLGAVSVLTGFAIYKPVQLWWLTAAFGGFELARYWHFISVWLFVAFTVIHVALVFLVDPASLRAMITGTYRGPFPSRDWPRTQPARFLPARDGRGLRRARLLLLTRMTFTPERPGGYWEDRGYPWFAGV